MSLHESCYIRISLVVFLGYHGIDGLKAMNILKIFDTHFLVGPSPLSKDCTKLCSDQGSISLPKMVFSHFLSTQAPLRFILT